MVANVLSKGMMAAAMTAVTLGLGACGVKSSPLFPEGTTYPREYPYASPQSKAPAPSAPSGVKAGDKDEKTERGQRSPLGFPLEYPNRPSYQ